MPLIRAVALNVIKSLVPLNLPAGRIIGYLQTLNITYRRTEMLADIRQAFGRVKYETQVRGLMGNQAVPEGWMSKEELGAPYNYRVHLEVDYYDASGQVRVTEDRFMFSDDYKVNEDYESDFPAYAEEYGGTSDYEYIGSKVIGVTKNMRTGVPF